MSSYLTAILNESKYKSCIAINEVLKIHKMDLWGLGEIGLVLGIIKNP